MIKLRKLPGFLWIVCIVMVICSCREKAEQAITRKFGLRSAEAGFRPVILDSVYDYMVVPLNKTEQQIFPAGQSLRIPITSNLLWATSPRTLAVQKPKIVTPGSAGASAPGTIRILEKPIPAKMPETFIPREMEIKTPNPSTFSSWGKLHGLKSETVTALMQDKMGNIWICSSRGVTRYDGKSFSNFTIEQGLPHNDVRSILEDSKGNIWFGTNGGGVSKYDGYSFTNLNTGDGLINNYVATGMVEDSAGNIWMATWEGLSKYDGKQFINFTEKQGLINKTVEAIIKDKQGRIWIGTRGGLSVFDGVSFSNYTQDNGLTSNSIMSIIEDSQGRIWLGTKDGGIMIVNKNSFEHLAMTAIPDTQINSLYEDKEGHTWIGTRDGLIAFRENRFKIFSEDQGLTNDNIFCTLEDNAGNLWVGTGSGGLLRYNSHSFEHITQSEGLRKNYVSSLYEDKAGRLWIGGWRGGVAVYDGKELEVITGDRGLFQDEVTTITQDRDGNYWLAVFNGIAKYDGRSFTYYPEPSGLVNEDVNDILQDSAGNIWIGTEDGISKFDGKTFTNLFHHGKEAKKIFSIWQCRSGGIWFCTSAGIIRYNGSVFEQLVSNDPRLQLAYYCMYEDRSGIKWFGSEKGLVKYDGHHLTLLGKTEGLISNEVMSINEDRESNLWIGTRYGLSKLSRAHSDLLSQRIHSGEINEEDAFFRNYTRAEGFLGVGSNMNAMIRSRNGALYVGTNNGVTYFDPAQQEVPSTDVKLQISAVKMFNQNIDWCALKRRPDSVLVLNNDVQLRNYRFDSLSKWYALPSKLSLDFNNNSISFDFVAISTDQPQNTRYRYQLVGYDNNYGQLTTQSTASYGNLSPGAYTFKVKAMNYRGEWSNDFSYSFVVRPPWWQTFGFRALALIAFSILVFFSGRFVSRNQLRKKQRQLENELLLQNERQRISSDLHDEIGSTLSSISIYTGLAKQEANKEAYLESISTNVNEVVSKLDDLVWRINPKYDSLGSVMYRIMAYAEPLAASKKIIVSVEEDEQSKSLRFSSDTKHHLYMILKELVNNAVKHADCDHITISFKHGSEKETTLLLVAVSDNGKGFDPDLPNSHRNGLDNIRHRAGLIKGSLVFNSTIGAGTNVSLRIPVE